MKARREKEDRSTAITMHRGGELMNMRTKHQDVSRLLYDRQRKKGSIRSMAVRRSRSSL